MKTLFIYGTLQINKIIYELLGRAPLMTPATLKNFARRALKNRPYPAIIHLTGDCVKGHLIEITEKELEILDEYEGDEYEKCLVEINTNETKGKSTKALTYILTSKFSHIILPHDWETQHQVTPNSQGVIHPK